LSAAGLIIELGKDDFLFDIQAAQEPLIEKYQDHNTKYLRPIDASLYEAIYHCGDSDVRKACAEYNQVIHRIRKIEKSVQKTMETVLDLTIDRVRETRRRLTELEHYRLTTGFDAGIIVTEPKFSVAQPKQLTAGAFSKDFSECCQQIPRKIECADATELCGYASMPGHSVLPMAKNRLPEDFPCRLNIFLTTRPFVRHFVGEQKGASVPIGCLVAAPDSRLQTP